MSNPNDYKNYIGDVNLEYGGLFIDLSDIAYGYANALRVTDLDSGCGFDGAVLVERITIYGFNNSQYVTNALNCYGINYHQDIDPLILADALQSYGYDDPDDSWNRIIIQTESGGPRQYDGWQANVVLREDENLLSWLEDHDWLQDFE